MRPPCSLGLPSQDKGSSRTAGQMRASPHLVLFSQGSQSWLPVAQWHITTAPYGVQFLVSHRRASPAPDSRLLAAFNISDAWGPWGCSIGGVKNQTLWAYCKCSLFKHFKDTLYLFLRKVCVYFYCSAVARETLSSHQAIPNKMTRKCLSSSTKLILASDGQLSITPTHIYIYFYYSSSKWHNKTQ